MRSPYTSNVVYVPYRKHLIVDFNLLYEKKIRRVKVQKHCKVICLYSSNNTFFVITRWYLINEQKEIKLFYIIYSCVAVNFRRVKRNSYAFKRGRYKYR